MTLEQLIDAVCANAKTGKWFSCTTPVEYNGYTAHIGIKAFGKWVQRIECLSITTNVPEQKTIKRMRELLTQELTVVLKQTGA